MTGIPRGTYSGSRDVAVTSIDGAPVTWATVYADVYRYQWPLALLAIGGLGRGEGRQHGARGDQFALMGGRA